MAADLVLIPKLTSLGVSFLQRLVYVKYPFSSTQLFESINTLK